MKQVDTGRLSFAELREEDMYYVDKTMLIADILSEGDRDVYQFTLRYSEKYDYMIFQADCF